MAIPYLKGKAWGKSPDELMGIDNQIRRGDTGYYRYDSYDGYKYEVIYEFSGPSIPDGLVSIALDFRVYIADSEKKHTKFEQISEDILKKLCAQYELYETYGLERQEILNFTTKQSKLLVFTSNTSKITYHYTAFCLIPGICNIVYEDIALAEFEEDDKIERARQEIIRKQEENDQW